MPELPQHARVPFMARCRSATLGPPVLAYSLVRPTDSEQLWAGLVGCAVGFVVVWVVATHKPATGEPLRGRAHLVVTVPLYLRWDFFTLNER